MDGSPFRRDSRAETRLGMDELPLPAPGRLTGLAFITRIEGPGYRPLGAAMSLDDADTIRGHLSAGCIDADIALQMRQVAREGRPRLLRYGAGSAFADLVLPCGGALEICVIPAPSLDTQRRIEAARRARRPVTLHLSCTAGRLSVGPQPQDALTLHLIPEPRLAVFGTGIEAVTFARLSASAGYETILHMPDPVAVAGVQTRLLRRVPGHGTPGDDDQGHGAVADARTAALLFFHDHDREIPILADLLASEAFFIGAQGSRRSAQARAAALRRLGLPEGAISRLRGPVGLVEAAREPRLLAVSVLAEVLQAART